MNELQAAERWLVGILRGDATLAGLVGTRIYASIAPQEATFPYVLLSYQGGPDRNAVGREARLFTRPVYLVKAVADAGTVGFDYSAADLVASAVDAVLLGAKGTNVLAGVTYQIDCAGREQPVRYPELSGAKRYAHVGGLYRLFIQTI
ncbi:MAG TPA: DUF3168 domain-containing protein [Armatimonadota bacterium]|nr:DUF3168 domain-containing protein [Armatimonadota bacterium]